MKPTAQSASTTFSGSALSEADIERWAAEATIGTDHLDLDAGTFLRDYKGGYEEGIDGPMFAVWLADDLDQLLAVRAAAIGQSEATLLRRAVEEFLGHPGEGHPGEVAEACDPNADLSGWQWLLHVDSCLARRLMVFVEAHNCHLNVVANRAVAQLLLQGSSTAPALHRSDQAPPA